MPNTVRRSVTVAELRAGDTLDETPPAIIESLTRKAIWGLVQLVQVVGEAKPRRLRLDASVMVLREEPTEQEQAQRRRTRMVEMLKNELAGWLKCDPARMLREIVEADRGFGEVLTWANLPNVLKAQAMFKHARTLWYHLGEPDLLTAVDEDRLLETFAAWWYINVRQLIEQAPRHDPLSRSTSVVSNIIDDCDGWAIQEIRSRIVRAGAHLELEHRNAQVQAARR